MKKSIWSFTNVLLVLIFILFYTFCGCQPSDSGKQVKPWVGKWVFIEYSDSTGAMHAWEGVYHYYDNGTFSSQILSPDRPSLTSDPSTLEEYKAAFDEYRAGYGTYTVNEEEGSLTYVYKSNMRPHRVGQPTLVYFEVKDDVMFLNYREMGIILTLKRETGIK
jgi:hypothetical protein